MAAMAPLVCVNSEIGSQRKCDDLALSSLTSTESTITQEIYSAQHISRGELPERKESAVYNAVKLPQETI
jgi:hypothetical protein